MSECLITGCNKQRSFTTDQTINLPLKTKWKTRIQGFIGSPLITTDKIFFSTPSRGQAKMPPGLCALDRTNGKILWELPLDHYCNIPILKVPDEKYRVVQDFICYSENRIFIYDGFELHSVGAATGEIFWKVRHSEFGEQKGEMLHGMLFHEGTLYVNADSSICAIDPANGALIETFDAIHPKGISFYNNRLYYADLGWGDRPSYLYCLDLGSQQLVWKTEITKLGEYITHDNFVRTGGAASPFPVICQGRIYMSLGSYLACFDAETGKCLWKTLEHFITKPVSDGKRVFGFNGYKSLLCFNADNGELIYESENIPFGGSQAQGVPLLAGKTLFVGTVGYLYAFDTETGKRVWEFSTGKKSGGFVSQPVLLDGCLYAGDSLGHFYCFVPQK